MHCLANFCYVCLEEKDKLLSNINSSLSVNKDIIHILGYLPFNLAWLKTLQIILICEECCLRLRENYQFMEKCLKNSSLLQSYMNNLITTSTSNTENTAELVVKLNIRHKDINEAKCKIQSEDEEIYTIQWQPNIEETEDVFVNTEDYFVKVENTWKQEEIDDAEEYPTDNNYIENMDNESNSEVALGDNTHLTNTDGVSSGFTCKQAHASNKNDINTAKSTSDIHTRRQTDEKSYECAMCHSSFNKKKELVVHMRIHTGDKPYSCSKCKRYFTHRSHLVTHMRIHTGDKPYSCSGCKRCFTQHSNLVTHMRIHTGDKPHSCSRCKKCFTQRSHLITHMRIHTGDKPYSCSRCKRCFTQELYLIIHMRKHTGEKPYECSNCKKCFVRHLHLVNHMRIHTGEKPYECSTCTKCFRVKSTLVRHMRIHTGKK